MEDDLPKRIQIAEWVNEFLPDVVLTIEYSVNAAMRAIKNNLFDLIILDMSLPTYTPMGNESGGRPQGFGGQEVLRLLDRRKLSPVVVVVTQFQTFGTGSELVTLEMLAESLNTVHPQTFRGIVFYEGANGSWKNVLHEKIFSAIQLGESKNEI